MSKEHISESSIIDCHTRASGVEAYNFFIPRLPFAQSIAELEKKMAENKISYCIVFPMPFSLYYDPRLAVRNNILRASGLEDFPYQVENKALLYEVGLSSKCFLPFLAVNPKEKVTEQMDFLKKQRAIFGLKLHTVATNSSVQDLEHSPFLELLEKRNIPLMVHSGRTKKALPDHILPFAQKHPNIRVCIAHLAGFDKDIITKIKNTNNIFVDTSPFLSCCYLAKQKDKKYLSPNNFDLEYSDPMEVLISINNILKGRLIWGTDEPWTILTDPKTGQVLIRNSYKKECEFLKSLDKRGFSDIKFEISNKNIKHFLGFD